MELVKQADPLLRAITEETDETSLLLVVDGKEALCLRRADGDQPVRVLIMEAGKHIPFNCGAAGRVLLAHLPDAQWEEVIVGHTRRATKYSLVSREELDRDRHEIRERGYAVGWEDCARSACSLGAPVRAAGGAVVASVSILGILERFSAERLPIPGAPGDATGQRPIGQARLSAPRRGSDGGVMWLNTEESRRNARPDRSSAVRSRH